jgi:hypothetical protein
MRLQQVATTWTRRTNTLLIVKLIGLDISRKNMVIMDNISSSVVCKIPHVSF